MPSDDQPRGMRPSPGRQPPAPPAANAAYSNFPAAGQVIVGKYRIDHVLGAGGMGVVLAAHHLQLPQRVAIKFMRVEAARDAHAVERFLREARAAAALSSEHVTRVLDVGTLEGGEPYMVMEYLDGVDLSRVLEQRGPLPIDDAVGCLLQACEALAEAHALGIVHRDLKPANLFLNHRRDGTTIVKVLDFGISKVADLHAAGSAGLTASGLVMGSPGYMSPEQVRSAKGVDPRTDVWGLGVILFELVTGTRAFGGETVGEVLAQILSEPPPSVRHYRADAPEGLGVVIAQCLERRVERRIQNVGELATKLVPFGPPNAKDSLERILRWRAAPIIVPAGAVTQTGVAAGGLPLDTEPAWHRSGTADMSARGVGSATKRIALLAAGIAATIGIGAYVLLTRPTPREGRVGLAPATSVAADERALPSATENVTSAVLAPGPEALAATPLDAGPSKARAAASAATRVQPTRRVTKATGAYPASTSTTTSNEKDLY